MKQRKSSAIFATALSLMVTLSVSLPVVPASAMQGSVSTPMSTSLTQKELKKKGYKCETVSLGFVECTKGSTKYWCSGGTCTKKRVFKLNFRLKAVAPVGIAN